MTYPKTFATLDELCALEVGEQAHIEKLAERWDDGERSYANSSGYFEFARNGIRFRTTYRFDFEPDTLLGGFTVRLTAKSIDGIPR